LEWCFNVDDSFLDALSVNCLSLQVLGIENCDRVSDDGLSLAVSRLNKLTFVSADNCSKVGPKFLQMLSMKTPNTIVDLFINKCMLVNDDSMENIAMNCKKLVNIGIEECKVTDKSVIRLANNCPLIRILGLNSNNITDASVDNLALKCCSIERLYLSHTKISNRSLITISNCCDNIKSLALIGCNVDCVGLLCLGQKNSKCRNTLKDLHLSEYLSLKYNFYKSYHQRNTKLKEKKSNNKNYNNADYSRYNGIVKKRKLNSPSIRKKLFNEFLFEDINTDEQNMLLSEKLSPHSLIFPLPLIENNNDISDIEIGYTTPVKKSKEFNGNLFLKSPKVINEWIQSSDGESDNSSLLEIVEEIGDDSNILTYNDDTFRNKHPLFTNGSSKKLNTPTLDTVVESNTLADDWKRQNRIIKSQNAGFNHVAKTNQFLYSSQDSSNMNVSTKNDMEDWCSDNILNLESVIFPVLKKRSSSKFGSSTDSTVFICKPKCKVYLR
jgi:hypothetical protein